MRLIALFLLVSNLALAQDNVFGGFTISDKDPWMFNVHAESNVKIAFARLTVNSNLDNYHRIDLKCAIRAFKVKDFSVFIALPPMYYTVGKGYITPLNLEIHWRECLLINVDYYRDQPIFSIQARVPLTLRK